MQEDQEFVGFISSMAGSSKPGLSEPGCRYNPLTHQVSGVYLEPTASLAQH